MLTIELTDTGYNLLLDGVLFVSVPYDPSENGKVPFSSPEAAQAHADAYVASLVPAEVTPQE